jgi:hypothetical protein
MHRAHIKAALCFCAVTAAVALLGRAAPAQTTGVRVDNTADGLVVTVATEAANIHFTYNQSCDGGKPCYEIDASQGMVGLPASAGGCTVKMGNGSTPTAITCPDNSVGSIQFTMTNGGTWSAYNGGGGQHIGTICSPARVIVKTGKGANSIDTWDGCHEVVFCDSGSSGFAAVEADASDDIHGTCSAVVKH